MLKKRANIRVYNEGEEHSKSSLVSDELYTLRCDLNNATKSLENSLAMAESLKESLQSVAVDKQKLATQLRTSQACSAKLKKQIIEQRKSFQQKTNRMQYEIDEIKSSMAATKIEFFNTNAELRRNLKTTTQTTNRLSLMFLRMKESKKRLENKKALYERISNDFSKSINEQANIIDEITRKNHKNYKPHSETSQTNRGELLNRVSQLLNENANLRLKLAAEMISHTNKSKNITDKLIDRVASKLAKERFDFEQSINSSIDLDDSEITVFQQNCHLKRSNSF